MSKRIFDILLAAASILALSPLFALIALFVKFGSPRGPILYRSQRIGRWGKPFWFLKFRTMVVNADMIGGPSTAEDDPRITRVGSLLRKYKLDELPQLLNVLRGEMSIVGPRPEVPEYAALLTDRERIILSVPPGLTDWATLWNSDEGAALAGSSDPEREYVERIRPTKIALQLEYVRRHSLLTDVVILFRTFVAIVFQSSFRPKESTPREISALGHELD